jgi:hypothetical protein
MARQFINMYLEEGNDMGYYFVEYIDSDGSIKKEKFNTDLDARDFYDQLMSPETPTQSE